MSQAVNRKFRVRILFGEPNACDFELAAYRSTSREAHFIHNLALDIDEEIGRLLKDRLLRRLYEYDGQFFTPRGGRYFHTAFDGLHLLEWLSNSSLETFFRGRGKHDAIRWMLEELGKHAWVARVLRMNWEEFQTLGLVRQEALDAIINGARKRSEETNPPRLSSEEQAFFQFFEEQMQSRFAKVRTSSPDRIRFPIIRGNRRLSDKLFYAQVAIVRGGL